MPENETVCIVTGKLCPESCPAHNATATFFSEIRSRLAPTYGSLVYDLSAQQLFELAQPYISRKSVEMARKVCEVELRPKQSENVS